MTERRLKLLTLMARRAQFEMGPLSVRLNLLRQTELQQFDLADRLRSILMQEPDAASRSNVTRGQLGTSQFMQQAVITQLDVLQKQASETKTERNSVEAELGQRNQHRSVLQDQADATRRSLIQIETDSQFSN